MKLMIFVVLVIFAILNLAAGRPEEETVQPTNVEDKCKQPLNRGDCRASMPRFYYDAETKTCKGFLYGGCRGNENNFKSQEECEKACIKPEAESNTK